MDEAWEWFMKKGGGLEACLSALHRYGPELYGPIVNVLTYFGRGHFMDLFTSHFQTAFPSPAAYLNTIHDILPSVAELRSANTEILESDVIDFWLDICTQESDATETDGASHMAALGLLTTIWSLFPSKIDEREDLAN
jgi:hypothetical protein